MSGQGNAATSEGTKKAKAVKLRKGVKQLNLIDALPTALLLSIIALLPISSLYTCRCVCKLFLRLIEKHFAELSIYTTIVYKNDVGVHLLELAKGYCKSYKSIFPRCTKIVGSCDGLLCSVILDNYDREGSIYEEYNRGTQRLLQVCNPVLGQYAILPNPEINFMMKDVYGFGVSSRTRSYKVLRISTRRDPPHLIYKKRSDAQIVTIGTDNHKWRRVDGYLPYPSNQEILAPTVEGSFHWLFDDERKNITSLHAFNLEEEQHYQIPIPSNINNCNVMRVGVLHNCLCIFDNSVPGQFSIWSMKEYGVMESWSIECTLNASIPGGLDASPLVPVTVMKDKLLLFKSQNGNFYTYDQKNTKFAKFKIENMEVLGEFNGPIVHSSNFCPDNILATGSLKLEDSLEAALRSQLSDLERKSIEDFLASRKYALV